MAENRLLLPTTTSPTPHDCVGFTVTADAIYILHNNYEESFLTKADLGMNLLSTEKLPYTGLGLWYEEGRVHILGYVFPDGDAPSRLSIYVYSDTTHAATIEVDKINEGGKFLGNLLHQGVYTVIIYQKEFSRLDARIYKYTNAELQCIINNKDAKIGKDISLYNSGNIIIMENYAIVTSGSTLRKGGAFFVQIPFDEGAITDTSLQSLLSEEKDIDIFMGKRLSSGEVLFWGEEPKPYSKNVDNIPNKWWFGLYDPIAKALIKTATVQLASYVNTGMIYDVAEFQGHYLVATTYGLYFLTADFNPGAVSLLQSDELLNIVQQVYVAPNEIIFAGGRSHPDGKADIPTIWRLNIFEDFERLPEDFAQVE